MASNNGNLILVVGPSGVGKGAVMHGLVKVLPRLKFLVTCTTREVRPGEVNGTDYHFIPKAEFEDGIKRGEFLEHDHHYDNYYGTRRKDVEGILHTGTDALSDLNWAGVKQILPKMPRQVLTLLVLPPSLQALEDRLNKRQAMGGKPLSQERMDKIRDDMNHLDDPNYVFTNPDMIGSRLRDYDYIVVNEDLDTTITNLASVIEKLRTAR
ncbi:MAG: guanylate kinase [Alphaproteobacteria bacterium]